ncbi:hypothetical protein B0H63DRAFT_565758 [Podospora didyma]|uniref:NAD(P)-binding domain-containing protein n=1 Tax=Podospora didyma TaxID=330526 RepID=A0AAE0N1Z0_9PEZI|nr:hypothetical protein B0H63DRAFT_565758 [Podospora didyma]
MAPARVLLLGAATPTGVCLLGELLSRGHPTVAYEDYAALLELIRTAAAAGGAKAKQRIFALSTASCVIRGRDIVALHCWAVGLFFALGLGGDAARLAGIDWTACPVSGLHRSANQQAWVEDREDGDVCVWGGALGPESGWECGIKRGRFARCDDAGDLGDFDLPSWLSL